MSDETLSVTEDVEKVLHDTNEAILEEANQLQAEGKIGHAMDEARFVMGEIIKLFNQLENAEGASLDPDTWELDGPEPEDPKELAAQLLTAREKTLEEWRAGRL